ncbi:MAG: Uma2 family endonuclease [Gammaproteobacteria bacterium]|nr:Uma2 family endonuclease [Gammaproteobacteria bacterium]
MTVLKQEYLPHYTSRDYEIWEGSWELIEGVPYAMSPAPTISHQFISQKIAFQLSNLLTNCKNCKALLPVDWKINEETIVQPDNLVVCGEVSGQYLTKAPKVIFEVLSPSTAHKDTGIKFDLYQQEGVAYYIIVNPEESVAKVYKLTEDGRLIKKMDAQNDQYLIEIEGCELNFDFSQIWDND